MSQRSTLLKGVSWFLIISSVISLIRSIRALVAAGGFMNVQLGELPEFIRNGMSAIVGIIFALTMISCIFDIICGIAGLRSGSVNTVLIRGVIMIVFAAVSIVFSIGSGIAAVLKSLVGAVVPVLYCIGAKKCVQ